MFEANPATVCFSENFLLSLLLSLMAVRFPSNGSGKHIERLRFVSKRGGALR